MRNICKCTLKWMSVLASLTTLNAGDDVIIGAGAYSYTQPYKGVDAAVIPTPVIFFDNSLFYARWAQFGLYFLGDKNEDVSWGLSVTAQPNPFQYDAKDSATLTGMSDRKTTWEGGLDFIVEHKIGWFELTYYHELLGLSKYNSVVAQVGTTFHAGKFRFDPILLARYNDTSFNNYYYGVEYSEATPLRPYYKADDDFNLAIQTYITYPISERFVVISNLRADYLGANVSDSPIVDTHYRYSLMLSLNYKFSYSATKEYFFGK